MLSILFCPRKGTTRKGGHCHIPHGKGTPTKGGIHPYPLGTPRKEVGCGYRIIVEH